MHAILFDFDGTIADTEPLHFSAFAEVLARRGIELTRPVYDERYLSLTDRECFALMVEDFRRPDLRAELSVLLAEKTAAMRARLSTGVPLFPGAEDFVTRASEHARLAIVSGALRAEIGLVLQRAGLARFFPIIVAAEDVRSGKPDPDGYRQGWRRLRDDGLPDLEPRQCLVIEDAPKGVDAAHAAGMRVVALAHTVSIALLEHADRAYRSYAAIDWRELSALFD
jgi:beta-phosphoglucomutase